MKHYRVTFSEDVWADSNEEAIAEAWKILKREHDKEEMEALVTPIILLTTRVRDERGWK